LTAAEWSRSWGLRFRARERWSRSLLFVPALYVMGALLLAEVVTAVEGDRDLLALGLDPDTARAMLSAVAGGMIAFTGLVVSVAVLVVQFGASQYTPRLVNLFRRDPRVKHSLGIFLAPTIFALVSLRKIGESDATAVPSLTVAVSTLLLIAALLAFLLLTAGLLDLLRPRRVIGQVVRQAREAIDQTYPAPLGAEPSPTRAAPPAVTQVVHLAGGPGVLSALDRGLLVRAAQRADAVVEVCRPIGAYVPTGAELYLVRGGTSPVEEQDLRNAALLDEERTLAQDPAFALRIVVDVAIRALSPAVNDPTTAVQALDGLGSLMGMLAGRDLGDRGALADADGRLRVMYPTPTWEDLVALAFTEVRRYGADSPQVPRRMTALIHDLLAHTPELRHGPLVDQLRRLEAAVHEAVADPAERARYLEPDILGLGTHRRVGARDTAKGTV
jgi:uncharacterized membrane protein